MKFSGKMWDQGFTLSLEDTFFEKLQGGQIDPSPPLTSSPKSYRFFKNTLKWLTRSIVNRNNKFELTYIVSNHLYETPNKLV